MFSTTAATAAAAATTTATATATTAATTTIQAARDALLETWEPVTFTVEAAVHLMWRSGGAGQFARAATLPLGRAPLVFGSGGMTKEKWSGARHFKAMPEVEEAWIKEARKAEQRRRGLDDSRQRGKRRGRKSRRTPEERAEINRRTPEEIEAIRAERRAKKERLEASEDAARAQVAAEVGEVVDAADVQIEAQAVLMAGPPTTRPVGSRDNVGLGNRWPGPRVPLPGPQ